MRCLPDQDLRFRKIALERQEGRCALSGRLISAAGGLLVDGLSRISTDDARDPQLRGMARDLTPPHLIAWWLLPLLDEEWCQSLCLKGRWVVAGWPSREAIASGDHPDLPPEAFKAPFAARAWLGLLFQKEIRAWGSAFALKRDNRVEFQRGDPPTVITENQLHARWVLIPRLNTDTSQFTSPSWPPEPQGWDKWLRSQPSPNNYWNEQGPGQSIQGNSTLPSAGSQLPPPGHCGSPGGVNFR